MRATRTLLLLPALALATSVDLFAQQPTPAQAVEALLGNWTCDTPEGRARLGFHSDSELSYNGERVPYELRDGAIRVVEDFWPVDYKYQFQGEELVITGPDYSTSRCRRQAEARPGSAGGLAGYLQGHRCDYSSSPDGGASSSRHLYFDGQGRFVLAHDASIWVEGGIAGADDIDGERGSYEVTGTNRGDPIHLSFDSGAASVLYVHLVDGSGRILELWRDGRSFAESLCH